MKLDQMTVSKAQLRIMYPDYSVSYLMEIVNDVLTRYGKTPSRRHKKTISAMEFKKLREEYLGSPTHDVLGKKL